MMVAKKKKTGKKKKPKKSSRTKVSESDKELLRYLDVAVDLEKNATKFYTTARNKVEDFNMKVLLNVLLEKEVEHLVSVIRMRDFVKKKKRAQVIKEAQKFKVHRLRNPFRDMTQWEKITKSQSGIFGVLNKAIELEEKANKFYVEAAKHAKGKFIKNYLLKLAHEEIAHRDYIKKHKDAVYNYGYWFGIQQPRLNA